MVRALFKVYCKGPFIAEGSAFNTYYVPVLFAVPALLS